MTIQVIYRIGTSNAGVQCVPTGEEEAGPKATPVRHICSQIATHLITYGRVVLESTIRHPIRSIWQSKSRIYDEWSSRRWRAEYQYYYSARRPLCLRFSHIWSGLPLQEPASKNGDLPRPFPHNQRHHSCTRTKLLPMRSSVFGRDCFSPGRMLQI